MPSLALRYGRFDGRMNHEASDHALRKKKKPLVSG